MKDTNAINSSETLKAYEQRIIELSGLDSSRPEIAADIGMSKGTVYYYQKKHELI